MSVAELKEARVYRHPDQPTLVYDIHDSWENNVKKGPMWKGGFPPIPKEKRYNFLGLELISPITIPAGPASGQRWTDFFFDMGFSIVMEKTRRR